MGYSFKTGVWKSIKNTIIVLLPAFAASWAAFVANAPTEYAVVYPILGGFFAYLVNNFIKNKD